MDKTLKTLEEASKLLEDMSILIDEGNYLSMERHYDIPSYIRFGNPYYLNNECVRCGDTIQDKDVPSGSKCDRCLV